MFNLKKSQNQLGDQLNEAIEMLNSLQIEIPVGTTPEQIIAMAEQMQQAAPKIQDAGNNVAQIGDMQEQIGQQMLQNQQQRITKTNVFNLKKAQEAFPSMDPMGLNNAPGMMGNELEMQQQINPMEEALQFQTGSDLKDWLDQNEGITARTTLLRYIQEPSSQQILEDMLSSFYEDGNDENTKLKIAVQLFEILPDSLKQIDPNQEGVVMAPFTQGASQAIKKLAKENIKTKKAEPFNLKTAQHKAFDNIIMYGPEAKRIDPFLHQPISDQHILERNKGFGLVVDDVWNIDWETIWRESVMDKYSRPYRDKDGNWVGGYIQKRFEVDKNIPKTSNMQLKPGQRRRPILPEYGNTESRLQAARAAGDIEGGPDVDKTEPFNWKEAKKNKKMIKKANILHSVCGDITDKLSEQDVKNYIAGDVNKVEKIINSRNLDSHSKKLVAKHIDFLIRHDAPFLQSSRKSSKKKMK